MARENLTQFRNLSSPGEVIVTGLEYSKKGRLQAVSAKFKNCRNVTESSGSLLTETGRIFSIFSNMCELCP